MDLAWLPMVNRSLQVLTINTLRMPLACCLLWIFGGLYCCLYRLAVVVQVLSRLVSLVHCLDWFSVAKVCSWLLYRYPQHTAVAVGEISRCTPLVVGQ